jgi:hypothetical protein
MQTSVRTFVALFFFALVTPGCATSFTGDAHVAGPSACVAKCKEWGMDLSGMVAMGEYSDACICRVRGKGGSGDETGSTGAAAVGVVMQMRAMAMQQHGMMR